jgi:hypothetical protein
MEAYMKRNQDIFFRIARAFENTADPGSGIIQGVRPLRQGQPHLRTFLFPSLKSGGNIPCEGGLEKDAALCFEVDPTVDEYRGQPFLMEGPKGAPIVPDFAIRRGHFYAVVDVKPKGQLLRPGVRERMRWIRQALGAIGIPHYLLTEEELHTQPGQQIRYKLRRGQTVKLRQCDAHRLLERVRSAPTTVADLRGEAITLGLSPFAAEKLALSGRLTFPINTPWRETTPLGGIHDEPNRTTAANWGSVHDLRLPL